MADKLPDLRFYSKKGELLLRKAELKNDLVITKLGTLINPGILFSSIDRPFSLITNNAIPSVDQARELKGLFSKSSLQLVIDKVYSHEIKENNVLVTVYERR